MQSSGVVYAADGVSPIIANPPYVVAGRGMDTPLVGALFLNKSANNGRGLLTNYRKSDRMLPPAKGSLPEDQTKGFT